MTCTTFLHDGELNRPTSCALINELLADVRAQTGRDWQIIERSLKLHKPWWKFWARHPKTITLYEIYVYIGGMGPWQQINFFADGEWSINLRANSSTMVAYLYGVLAGIHSYKLTHEKTN